jgi:hypothetical protein
VAAGAEGVEGGGEPGALELGRRANELAGDAKRDDDLTVRGHTRRVS